MEYYLGCSLLNTPSKFLEHYSNPPSVVLDSGESNNLHHHIIYILVPHLTDTPLHTGNTPHTLVPFLRNTVPHHTHTGTTPHTLVPHLTHWYDSSETLIPWTTLHSHWYHTTPHLGDTFTTQHLTHWYHISCTGITVHRHWYTSYQYHTHSHQYHTTHTGTTPHAHQYYISSSLVLHLIPVPHLTHTGTTPHAHQYYISRSLVLHLKTGIVKLVL